VEAVVATTALIALVKQVDQEAVRLTLRRDLVLQIKVTLEETEREAILLI
jgi:hypothetical protein